MAATTVAPEVDAVVGEVLAAEVEAWLADPTRTAHRLVSVPTAQLVAQAVAGKPAPVGEPSIPGRAWRMLPTRLLALHPRRGDALERLRISPAGHLHLTAAVLERWGWARTGERLRTAGGRRCILGAQRVVSRLGYGTDVTVGEAGRLLDGVLAGRGITMPYYAWNEMPSVTGGDALALVREAIGGAR